MTETPVEILRREFDAGFAAPPHEVATDLVALLIIRVGEKPYALRVSELGGTAAGQRITPVPSSNRALLGLCGIRGNVVPVFDLAILLGEPRASDAVRYLALSAGHDPVAFAFAELEGYVRVGGAELGHIAASGEQLISDVLQTATGLRPIIEIPAAVASVRRLLPERHKPEPHKPSERHRKGG